tara:strand:+ start:290 stop:418 length:129 start_codon:yes stop_codon:yes gene_type:complete
MLLYVEEDCKKKMKIKSSIAFFCGADPGFSGRKIIFKKKSKN